jgi:hypothetical protein
MKQLLYIVGIVMTTIVSCNKLEESFVGDMTSVAPEDAIKEFSIILSKAASNDHKLRLFMKEEALNMFDMDYDVFYPLIKDKIVYDGKSFKMILKQYDTNNVIEEIEKQLPYLNILIPDWSWLDEDCFSVFDWDTVDDMIVVTYNDVDGSHHLYMNGEYVGLLDEGNFPVFPILIVKENERMRLKDVPTKSNRPEYEFVNEVFDGSKRIETKAKHYTEYWDYDNWGLYNYEFADKLSPLVINAYNEFGDSWNNAMHRDYIYYGMTKNNTTHGVLNKSIVESIYRFRIKPEAVKTICDTLSNDPYFIEIITKDKKKNKLSGNEIQALLWSEGALEIEMKFYLGDGTPDSMTTFSKIFTVQPKDLWEVKTSAVTRTWDFKGYHYKYVSNISDLVMKWYYPTYSVELPRWDISSQSDNLWFSVYEKDKSGTSVYEVNNSYSYASNFKVNANTSLGSKIKSSLGLEHSDSDNRSKTAKLQFTTNYTSNFLGDANYDFSSRIIMGGIKMYEGVEVYELKSVSTGTVDVTFMPKLL